MSLKIRGLFHILTIAQAIFVLSLVPIARDIQAWLREVQFSTLHLFFLAGAAVVIALFYCRSAYRDRSGRYAAFHLALLTLLLLGFTTSIVTLVEWSHLFLYGGFTLFFLLARMPHERSLPKALLISTCLSLADETLQWLHPERVFDLRDLALNLAGSLTAIWLLQPFRPLAGASKQKS